MSAEELEKLIEFEEFEHDNHSKYIRASVTISSHTIITAVELLQTNLVNRIKDELKERVMRRIYDDQRDELYKNLADLFYAAPFNIEEMHKAKNNLLKAARRQG